jgi:hypothetical protein
MMNRNKYVRELALNKLKEWIEHNDDYGKLCQFSWRHNRKRPAFYNYPIIQVEDDNSLDTTIDELISGKSGYTPSDEKLYKNNIPIYAYFDMVAIHKGKPIYCFKLVDTVELRTVRVHRGDNSDLDLIDSEDECFYPLTYELQVYHKTIKDNTYIEIHYIDINYVMRLESKPEILETKLIYKNVR